jgi:transposase
MGKRRRRTFTPEQRAEAVKMVLESGRSVASVARDLDLTTNALATWVKQAKVNSGHRTPGCLASAERTELVELKRENKRLAQENSFLKKANAFFARESL